ncbi:hypothetical protein [Streptomyces sp. AK02-04a]|uniref:hypothetical protein n=1 Tax=Streptomyces sp. AK02-04a TaxID=3028649 RepID=UPI0029A08EDA|nr:hypothetical protein [Streptomyces sp. AK02-04a]MDX3761602.1 hypothetical protein [Streptomyces sp. AK02-04a]
MTWVAWRHEERRTAATGRFLQARAAHKRGPWRAEGQEVKRPTQDQPPPGGKASRAASLREVERFRESIRAAEQRRAARQDSPTEAPPADTEQHTPAEEHLAASDAALQVHLAACIQAAQNQDWGLLKDTARQLAEAAAQLNAETRSGQGTQQDNVV